MYPGPATLIIVILIALAIQGLLQLDKRIEKQMEIERESHLLTNGEELSCNLDDQQAAGRFSQLLQFPSVSFKGEEEEEPTKLLVFRNMVQFLRSSYPTVFSAMEVKMLGGANLSMLLKWEVSCSLLTHQRELSAFFYDPSFNCFRGRGPTPRSILYYWSRTTT